MICYLPFANVAQPFDILSKTLGTITVYGPSNAIDKERVHKYQQEGLLDLRMPQGLDDAQFLRILEDYKQWAQLHDGSISDMAQFFYASQDRPPLIDENAPSQIRDQVRQQGRGDREKADPVLQSALFLALAQEHDQHQDRLHQDFGMVADMERNMYAALGSDEQGGAPATGNTETFIRDHGTHMTDRRIKAWAQIAFGDTQPSSRAYITPSPAVFDHLKAQVPETLDIATWYLSSQGDTEALKRSRLEAIEEMSRTQNLDTLSLNSDLRGHCTEDTVALVLIGWRGSLFESILPKRFAQTQHLQGEAEASDGMINTVLGLVG